MMRASLIVTSLLFAIAPLAGCPATVTPDTSGGGKTVPLQVPGVDFALDLPDDGLGAWALLEGAGKEDGAFGRATPAGTHATTINMLSATSCDTALAAAKQSASALGKTLNAADRPQWLPSRYWPVGLEIVDGDLGVWIACLDTKRGPLGVTTTVTPAAGAPHAASAPHVKIALDKVADAALAAAAKAPSWKVGDVVDVEWRGTWYSAKILSIEGAQYKIHYEGWGAEWDESVPTTRMRAHDPNAPIAPNPPNPNDIPVPG